MRGGTFVTVLVFAVAVSSAAHAAFESASKSEPILFQADEVQYDQDLGLTVAKGNVEITQNDQLLLADTVTYNQRTDVVTATGHVSLLQPTGEIIFADYMELHDNLRDGFIKDVRMLLSDRSRMAGNTARRVDGNRTELRRGVYSPCELCKDDPTKPPVWQIKAEEIVHDREAQTVEYHDAIMEFDGWPIFYTPYFSHPDPSVKRASGFLPPTVGTGSSLGYHATTPYFWVIDKDKDITFRPLLTTSAGVVLDQEYRQAFGFGKLDLDGSVGYGGRPYSGNPDNPTPGARTVRGHFFGTGLFDVNPDVRAGFNVQRASDQTYLLRYHFPQPNNFLTSHVYAEDFGARSYGNLSAYAFQSLNPTVGNSIQPIVAPAGSYNWISQPDNIGGRLQIMGSMVNLERRTGAEIRRASGGTEWSLPFNGPLGDRFTLLLGTRIDGYNADNVMWAATDTTLHTENTGRVFPQAALLWRYPWVRHDAMANEVIEPMAAFVAAPNGGNQGRIPNEDSQGFEFDETSLFRPNRLPGYDRVDSGQRADYGLHGGIYNTRYGSSSFLVGQSYRLQHQSPFTIGSGLETPLSDIVGRTVISPTDELDFFYRFRLNKSDLAMRRQETGLTAGPQNLRLSASFIAFNGVPTLTQIPANQINFGTPIFTTILSTDQVSVALNATLTRYWSIALHDTRSFSGGGTTINSGVALTYRDDCFAITSSIEQSGIRIGDVHPGVTMLLSFVFKNLGELDVHALSVEE